MGRSAQTKAGTKATILLVDDDSLLCDALKEYLERDGYYVLIANTLHGAMDHCTRESIDLVLLDEKLPDGDGSAACSDIIHHNPGVKILFITGYPSFEHALCALRQGAHDYLAKPFELEHLLLVMTRLLQVSRLEHLERVETYRTDNDQRRTMLVGGSKAMEGIRSSIALAAQSDVPVLVTGETGTGKTVVARAVHLASHRRQNAFLSISCANLPENLVEAELFGWEKGAYTGAVQARGGLFEFANGGTVFLDEIGDMPLSLQPKLLTVLDDGEVRRVGGVRTKRLNVRVIAATNVDLRRATDVGAFRRDLYFRLNVLEIAIPPLREHPEDIPALCDHFLRMKCHRDNVRQLAAEEYERLVDHNWPGNIRELHNVIERSWITDASELRPSRFLDKTHARTEGPAAEQLDSTTLYPRESNTRLASLEKGHIRETLAACDGNRTRAAALLGVSL